VKAVRDYAHSFLRKVVFRLNFSFLINQRKAVPSMALMDSATVFYAKKLPIEINGKLVSMKTN
jgi:hypothetical protein